MATFFLESFFGVEFLNPGSSTVKVRGSLEAQKYVVAFFKTFFKQSISSLNNLKACEQKEVEKLWSRGLKRIYSKANFLTCSKEP